ncbi:type IV pilin [Candidatus Bathyarchaeota archaeon]|nr:type IV pilin [Candidatus Bathyarchaeota archaeon]
MKKSIIAEKRALSPVIATVILISVTIVVAVSVAYWMGSIASGYTSFEQIELPTVYAAWNSSSSQWKVTIKLKNTGSADATIDNLFINNIPLSDYDGNATLVYDSTSYTTQSVEIPLSKGAEITLYLYLNQSQSNGFTAGTRVDLKIHTAAGRDYPAQVKLP